MYCVYGNSSWYNRGPLYGGCPLLGGSVFGRSTAVDPYLANTMYNLAFPNEPETFTQNTEERLCLTHNVL